MTIPQPDFCDVTDESIAELAAIFPVKPDPKRVLALFNERHTRLARGLRGCLRRAARRGASKCKPEGDACAGAAIQVSGKSEGDA